ncbi:NADP-dependent oxidoreductase [Membranicola marinus]|uniref:NADP-dependent oxidoreductase n=1 Tax=Membranihabitans marinus TaxID=1227546 RepID=A0A953HR56_9BACT|nr:NADP-dependent oxidoreductase [Membranihabitans marinus]MBY5956870.1 NADP-dependent oxidoreductase [Membranihabitans marinus]
MINQVIELAERPDGQPSENNFRIKEIETPTTKDGEVLVQSKYISVDPYMRGRMRDEKSYMPPFEVNAPIQGGVVAEILESKSDNWREGDLVEGILSWQRIQTVRPELLRKVSPQVQPSSLALSTLGMTGLTAYFGLMDIGQPQKGETVVVSGAAGAVGGVVVQIAKIQGCRVVAIAGSDEKTTYLENELGADVALNYKTTTDMSEALKTACPEGVDVYFDNVGGEISDAVIPLINKFARIVLCGQIALYNETSIPHGPRVAPLLVKRSALMKGFIVTDYQNQIKEGVTALSGWYQQGLLKHQETVVEGFEKLPQAFLRLFTGEKLGKLVVQVN